MEPRKPTDQKLEFELLHAKLKDLGLYENGMGMDQMRQVMEAVDESINEASFNDGEIEFALRESEREFASVNICNSTMIGSSENNTFENSSFGQHYGQCVSLRDFASPEVDCAQKITVVAEVHHELNWTPKKASTKEKGKLMSKQNAADAISQDDSGIILSSSTLFETTSL